MFRRFFEYGFAHLKRDVILKELCSMCGACVAVCPRIGLENSNPKLLEYDPHCGMCYAFCPKTFIPSSEVEEKILGGVRKDEIGFYRRILSARSKEMIESSQDGGVATSILSKLLDSGDLDCAVVTKVDERWRAGPVVVTSSQELKKYGGSKYTLSPTLMGVREAIEKGYERIGVVALPCQVEALRKIQISREYDVRGDRVKLIIGLFCTKTFKEQMMDYLESKLGVKREEIRKFDIKRGRMIIYAGERKEIRVKELAPFACEGCSSCRDVTAEYADLSIGSVGSPDGWSTVIIRSISGEKAIEKAGDALETGDANVDDIRKLIRSKTGE